MTLLNYFGRLFIFFSCLAHNPFVSAENSIGIRLDLSIEQLQNYQQKNFNILAVIQFQRQTNTGEPLMEFSGLAWDHDQNLLYALSDRGYITHLKPIFKNGQLSNVQLLAYYKLKDRNGKALTGKSSDSEGLALLNSRNKKTDDTEFIISFERIPRIIQYTTDGDFISEKQINNSLKDITNYSGANKALEAITLHEKYNIITGPERPLKQTADHSLSLHRLNDTQWSFKADNDKHGSLVGLTTLPDNKLIALERIFPGIFAGVSNVIHLITLSDNAIEKETLLKLRPTDGYFNENFEGISWHEENRFFMISDDNDNLLQRTILIYFEIPSLNVH